MKYESQLFLRNWTWKSVFMGSEALYYVYFYLLFLSKVRMVIGGEGWSQNHNNHRIITRGKNQPSVIGHQRIVGMEMPWLDVWRAWSPTRKVKGMLGTAPLYSGVMSLRAEPLLWSHTTFHTKQFNLDVFLFFWRETWYFQLTGFSY